MQWTIVNEFIRLYIYYGDKEVNQMDIAQITFYKTMNYGGTLQAYALNKILSKYGNCKCIDYIDANVVPKGVKATIQRILYLRRKKSFDAFIKKYIKTSKRYENLDEIAEDFDCCVCGSDQIWNPDMMGGVCSDFYFLNFGTNRMHKVAYAASIGKEQIGDKYRAYFKDVVSKFDNISLREKACVNELQQLVNKPVAVTLDPTLLLTKEDWDKVCTEIKNLPPYLLVYDLSASQEFTDAVNVLSEWLNLPVVHFRSKKIYKNELKSFFNYGPAEFLGLIKNAEFVFCSSFHGTVFSVIFEKEFLVWNSGKTSSRMKNLLDALGLGDRLLFTQEFNIRNKIDYVEVKKKLEQLKQDSERFIAECNLG